MQSSKTSDRRYGDERRTEIVATHQDLSVEDLITEEDLVVTISHQGYGKTQPLDMYRRSAAAGAVRRPPR